MHKMRRQIFGRLRAKPSDGLYAVFPFLLYAENRTYLCPFKDNLQEHMQNIYLGQYRTKIVRQMRRQIFRQMKQKAE